MIYPSQKETLLLLSSYFTSGGLSMKQEEARKIMGRNYFGIEEAIKFLRVNPSKEQIDLLSNVPFSEKKLKECKETHLLVAVFPLSFKEIFQRPGTRIMYNNSEPVLENLDHWYSKPLFGWYLVSKNGVDGSEYKDWDQQQLILGKDECVPSVWLVFYSVLSHYLATDEILLKNIRVRCIEELQGAHVFIGWWLDKGHGLHIDHEYDPDNCYLGSNDLKLASYKCP